MDRPIFEHEADEEHENAQCIEDDFWSDLSIVSQPEPLEQ